MDNSINILKIWDKKHHFSEKDLPTLIHYKTKEWWSYYSTTLIANLALQWSKILFLSGYSEAKEQFSHDTPSLAQQTVVLHTQQEIKKNEGKQIIVIHDDDEKLCLDAIKTLRDIKDRIIFIKNIDLFHKHLLMSCLKYSKLILSWDLDACIAKGSISKKKYNSVILFSQPKTKIPYIFVPLEKYTWYLWSKNMKCYVKASQ